MPRTITLANKKGGVGKTTLATALASLAASKGIRTVLIDIDPEGHSTLGLGGDVTKEGSIRLLIRKEGREPEYQAIAPNLTVVAGNYDLEAPEVANLDPEMLRDSIADLPFDLTIIDCPYSNQRLITLGRVAADVVLIPVNAHPFAIESAQRIATDIQERMGRKRPGPNRLALVANMIDSRRSLDNQIIDALKSQFPSVPNFVVRQDVSLAKATTSRTPIMETEPDFPSKPDFEKLLKWALK